jgi:hypothetical protein
MSEPHPIDPNCRMIFDFPREFTTCLRPARSVNSRQNVTELSGSWPGLGHTPSQDLEPAVDRWCQAAVVLPSGVFFVWADCALG